MIISCIVNWLYPKFYIKSESDLEQVLNTLHNYNEYFLINGLDNGKQSLYYVKYY